MGGWGIAKQCPRKTSLWGTASLCPGHPCGPRRIDFCAKWPKIWKMAPGYESIQTGKDDTMSTQEPYVDPNEMSIQPPKEGMSSGMKTLLIVGIIFGLLILLCCGGLVGVGIWTAQYMGDAMSQDPTVIAECTAQFVEMEIPSQFAPVMSFDMTVPFSDDTLMVWVVYADESSNSMLMMASLGAMMAQQSQGDVRRQLEQSMRQQGVAAGEGVDEWESSVKEIEVRGEPVAFNFAVGENADTGAQRIEVSGMFEGQSGPVMLILSADAKVIDEQAVVEMIESIK